MPNLDEILSNLGKKTRERVKLASEVKMVRHPYKSVGLTAATGGWVEGHFHLIYGPKSSGKSMVCYQTIADEQEKDPEFVAGVIDGEGTYDPEFTAKLGVDNSRVIVSHAKTFQQAQEIGVEFLNAGVRILVIDSISVLIPMAFMEEGELRGAENMKQIGVVSKSTGIMLNALSYANMKHQAGIFIISHAKFKFGAQHASHTFTGGQAMEHGATQIIKLSASAAAKEQIERDIYVNGQAMKSPIGREVTFFVEKNKSGPASGVGKYNMYYAGDFIGIDNVDEVFRLATKYNLIEKGGSWFTVNGRRFQGAEKAVEYLYSDLDYYDELQAKVLSIVG